MQNASRQEFDDALNSYHAPRSEFHADEFKNKVTSQAQGNKRFFFNDYVLCELQISIVCYLFNIYYLLY